MNQLCYFGWRAEVVKGTACFPFCRGSLVWSGGVCIFFPRSLLGKETKDLGTRLATFDSKLKACVCPFWDSHYKPTEAPI